MFINDTKGIVLYATILQNYTNQLTLLLNLLI
jgi:hypothetical protein